MLEHIKQRVSVLEAESRLLSQSLTRLKSEHTVLHDRLSLIETAQTFLKNVAISTQNQLSYELSTIASMAVDTVFPEPYEFQVSFIEKRNKTEIDFQLVRDSLVCDDPLNSVGGGVCDILSFSLRVSCILISGSKKILLLDEPFKNLSRDLVPISGTLLKRLSDELDFQFLIVSHDKSLIETLDANSIIL